MVLTRWTEFVNFVKWVCIRNILNGSYVSYHVLGHVSMLIQCYKPKRLNQGFIRLKKCFQYYKLGFCSEIRPQNPENQY